MQKIQGLECILLIDDDDATNYLHQMVIEDCELDLYVKVCSSARLALDFLSCKGAFASELNYPQPGIVFLDINMPKMNGWEFMKEYNKLPEEQKAKVVVTMITSSLNPDDRESAGQVRDIKEFIQKPLTQEVLEEIIQKHFRV